MTVSVVHPWFDEHTDEYAVFDASALRVSLSAPIRHFLGCAGADGIRPVLLTKAEAVLTAHLTLALESAGAHWVAEFDNKAFSAMSGYRIAAFEDLWQNPPSSGERLPGFEAPRSGQIGSFVFDVFTRERADDDTQHGAAAQLMVTGLGGAGFDRWGDEQPLTTPWSANDVTAAVRESMPATEIIRMAGPNGAIGQLNVARTRTGTLEHSRGVVPFGAALPPQELAADPRIAATLRSLAETHRPQIATISYAEFDPISGGVGQAAGYRRLNQPLAVLIGPAGVNALEVDIADLQQRHDVTVLGPGRVPSLLVMLTGRDSLWRQALTLMSDLKEERLAALLGVELEELRYAD